ncbi:MAG: InlB B-repeat-containing protein [Acidobacteriota bacterium]
MTAAPADHYHFVSWSDAVLTAARRDTSLTANVSVTASFTINTFALHYNDGPGGTLSGITSQTVDYGSSGTTVTAEHADHYHFVSWSDGVKTAIRRETSVSEDTSVTAAFAIDRFTVAYVSAGHGSIDGSLTQTMDYGSSGTTVTAVASPHYLFASWSDGVTSLSRRATSVSADSTLTATFLPVDTFTLRYLPGPGGKLQGTAYQTVGYNADGTTVTAEPDAHYQFVTWSDGVKTAARCEVAVTADSSVTASFALDTYHLAYAEGTGGIITGDTSQTVAYGSNGTTVTAVPAQYHYFVGWSDGVLTPARRETSVGAGVSATAEFAAYRVHLAYAAGTYGSVSGVTSQTVDQGSNGTTVTATPDVHAQFVSWSDGVLTAARRDIGVTSDVAVTAAFALDTFHLAYTAGAGGTISGVASQTVTYGASATTVTALPDAHYQFVSWSDGVKTAERCDKNVSGAVAATASFAIDTYHVAYTAGTGGTISGVASQTVAYGASATTVTAVPAAHRHFVSWSDGVKTAARRDKNVSGPLAFTASFAIDTYRLAYTAGAGGTLSGVTSQTVVYGSSGSLVTAVAGSGYRFTSWSDGVTTAARTDRSVAANIAVTARFSRVKTAVVVTGPMIKTGAILPANTWLKTSGYLTPRHAAGSQTVILTTAVYRLGRWSAGPRIVTTNSDYQTYSKWTSSRFAFYIKGQWRMQATSPADADHLAAVGPLVFFTVK